MHESCGVFGVYTSNINVAQTTFFALFALQHRGQESAGIAVTDGNEIKIHTNMGLVSQVFTETDLLAPGHIASGITVTPLQAQANPECPTHCSEIRWATIALAHNGNIINSKLLRDELQDRGFHFHTGSDSEVIANLFWPPRPNWQQKIECNARLQGAYSLVILTESQLIGVRDSFGVRPLCLGTIDSGWSIASESCALDHIGARFQGKSTRGNRSHR